MRQLLRETRRVKTCPKCPVVTTDFVSCCLASTRGELPGPSCSSFQPPHPPVSPVRQLACPSLAGGYAWGGRQDQYLKLLRRSETPHPSQSSSLAGTEYISASGCWRGVNNTFVRGPPPPPPTHERDRSGFIIASLDPCLSPIDL